MPYLQKVGFKPKVDVYFMPCSGFTGAFLKDPPPENICPWYRGPCFIEYIDSLPSISRAKDGPVRIPIVDKYSVSLPLEFFLWFLLCLLSIFKDMGTVVLGKVESGTVIKGQNLLIMPNKVNMNCSSLLYQTVKAISIVFRRSFK